MSDDTGGLRRVRRAEGMVVDAAAGGRRSDPLTPPCRLCRYPMRADDRVAGVYACPRCKRPRPPA